MSDIVRVLRIIEYVGPRAWVEDTVRRSVHGTRVVGPGREIRAATIGEYPDVLYQDVATEHPSGAAEPIVWLTGEGD